MPLSPNEMYNAVIRNLEKRTGKRLEQWVRVASDSQLTDQKELRSWLKAEYGLGGTTCAVIADATLRQPDYVPPTESELLAVQFAGDKAALRPLYDQLVGAVEALGADVRVGVRKTQTTFAREYTFAIAKAPTKRRMDLGMRLPGVAPTQRLAATKAFSDNATHCVALTTPADIDPELTSWLKAAYEARG